jgi:hypothetical protein
MNDECEDEVRFSFDDDEVCELLCLFSTYNVMMP